MQPKKKQTFQVEIHDIMKQTKPKFSEIISWFDVSPAKYIVKMWICSKGCFNKGDYE